MSELIELVLYDKDMMEVARCSGGDKIAVFHQMGIYANQYSEDGPVRCVREVEVPQFTSDNYWEDIQ